MDWLNNLSIRNKVSVIAVIGVVGFLAFLTLNYRLTTNVQRELVNIVMSDLPTLQFANELQVQFTQIEKGYQNALAEADEDLLDETSRSAAALSGRFYEIKKLNPEESVALEKLHETFNVYVDAATAQTGAVLHGEQIGSDTSKKGFAKVNVARVTYADLQSQFIKQWFENFNNRIKAIQSGEREIIVFGVSIGILVSFLLLLVSIVIIRLITKVLNKAVDVADQIANGNLHQDIDVTGHDETGQLLYSLRVMRDALLEQNTDNRQREEEQRALAGLNEVMRGDLTLEDLTSNVLRYLAANLQAVVGTFYIYEVDVLQLYATYAHQYRQGNRNQFRIGESIVGQCALEKKAFVVTDLPDDYIKVGSGVGTANPRSIVVVPVLFNGELKGVIELGSFHELGDKDMRFLNLGVEGIAISINSAQSRVRMAEVLKKTTEQADILQSQQKEMEKINLELEARSLDLDQQKNEILQKNQELERSKKVLMEKSEALEASGRYKTQFLSTMSHELRTPLNSILILSQALMDNRNKNLSPKDVEHASVIHSSGSDLLTLINDILDLSKVEEGKMELVYEDIAIKDVAAELDKRFKYIAQNKGLEFSVIVEEDLPQSFSTDIHRVNQVIKNFVSNAIKFTEKGGVYITIHRPRAPFMPVRKGIGRNDSLVISVRDTGTGIPKDKQEIIFEAFKQADGTTSRKYGGTGLGLTISRELSHLLGGEIAVHSEGDGTGSTFAVILPFNRADGASSAPTRPAPSRPAPVAPQPAAPKETAVAKVPGMAAFGMRTQIVERLLIVEDDEKFSRILSELIMDAGLSCDVVHNGADALTYLDHYLPQAIILDVSLPDMPGWEVIKKIKSMPDGANVPVHVVSALPEQRNAENLGARDFIEKPVSQNDVEDLLCRIKEEIGGLFSKVLIVEDSVELHEVIAEQFAGRGMNATFVETGAEALSRLSADGFDCMIVDLKLPDGDGLELLKKIRALPDYATKPVIVFTAEELTPEREFEISKYADRVIIKSNRAMERLLDATLMFVRSVSASDDSQVNDENDAAGEFVTDDVPSPKASQQTVREYADSDDEALAGYKVLLVDDDIRNIYSMSAILEDLGMEAVPVMSGAESLEKLAEDSGFHLVLMDIMMPEMDGYEAMRRIRAMSGMSDMPIIALTAKAMKEDRQLCIDAGASDYLSKPVDVELLKKMMAGWLSGAMTAGK